MRKIVLSFLLILLGSYASPYVFSGSADVIAAAYDNKTSDLQVQGSGVVVKILPDDNEGSRHQRFILNYPMR